MEPSTAAQPAAIIITRKSPKDVRDRHLIVRIDGERVATLMYGDEITREVSPAPHVLRVSNGLFWKTATLNLKPGEQARFEAVNRSGPGTYAMMLTFGAGPLYITLTRTQ